MGATLQLDSRRRGGVRAGPLAHPEAA
jgi:hypothetical protein